MSILSLEIWRPVPFRTGYEISSKGRARYRGRYIRVDGGMLTIGNDNIRMDQLMDKLFSNPAVRRDFRQMLLLRKPTGNFINLGGGLRGLSNRRTAVPLKPGP